MARMRRDVWKLGNDWHDIILWYARGVKALSARPFADMTSWRYLAAMHGVSAPLWKHNNYLKAGETLPNTASSSVKTGTSASITRGTSCPGIAGTCARSKRSWLMQS